MQSSIQPSVTTVQETRVFERFFSSQNALNKLSQSYRFGSKAALYRTYFEPALEPLVDVAVVEPGVAEPVAVQPVAVEPVLKDEVGEVEASTTETIQAEPTPLAEVKVARPLVEPEPVVSFFERIRGGLSRTRAHLGQGLGDLLLGKKAIDEDLFEELETQLLMSDLGVELTRELMDELVAETARQELKDSDAVYAGLKAKLAGLVLTHQRPLAIKDHKPHVILMVGVNGVGKTTTIGKLAKRLQGEGKSVMLAAGDTFRAAAIEQLQTWGERNDVPVIAQHPGADSASVIFDALQAAKARNIDVLIADTAGRLHTKSNLMVELEKVKRVMAKIDPNAPHDVMLVIDAGTGQNGLTQATEFNNVVGLTGITLTKLDGTAKGGIVFAVAKQTGVPIQFIGVGEQVDDLRPFDGQEFIEALFSGVEH